MIFCMIRLRKQIIFLIISLVFQTSLLAQERTYPYDIEWYPFIHYADNKIEFPADSSAFLLGLKKIHKMVSKGEGRLQILQIGGSHIQADMFTGEMRKRFQSFGGGLNAGRGFVFPYRLAHTNTPYGYYFRYTGHWETCRNVEKNKICNLGMAGIMAVTKDSVSSLTLLFEPENEIKYDFNRVKIYHRCDSLSFSIIIDSSLVDTMVDVPESDYTEIFLNRYVDSLEVFFVQTDSTQTAFELYGMNLETGDPGIYYHNLGINGAATSSFLRCNRFERQIATLKPDLVIFGLGINDAYGRRFSQRQYEMNYDTLVAMVRRANPDAAIIFTNLILTPVY